MHFHDFRELDLPVISSMLMWVMSCSQRGHFVMSAPFGDGCVGASIVRRERAGTPALGRRAAWAEMYAGTQLMLTAKGLHYQRHRARKTKEAV